VAGGVAVAHFDKRTSELIIGKDKSGRPRRILVPQAAAELLAAQTRDKLRDAPLFTRANGAPWDRETWK
jgi:integrase